MQKIKIAMIKYHKNSSREFANIYFQNINDPEQIKKKFERNQFRVL